MSHWKVEGPVFTYKSARPRLTISSLWPAPPALTIRQCSESFFKSWGDSEEPIRRRGRVLEFGCGRREGE